MNYCPPNVSSPFDCQPSTLATTGVSDPLPFVVIALVIIVIALVLIVVHPRN